MRNEQITINEKRHVSIGTPLFICIVTHGSLTPSLSAIFFWVKTLSAKNLDNFSDFSCFVMSFLVFLKYVKYEAKMLRKFGLYFLFP